jgi:lauroyl/myristoyl acyltransferase
VSDRRKPTLSQYSELWLWALLRRMPVVWASAIGAWLGARKAREGIGARRLWVQRMHASLERLCGISDAAERERRIVAFAARMGRLHAEYAVLDKIVHGGRLEMVGLEHLRDRQRPAILFSGHLANWELAGYPMAMLDNGCCALHESLDNPVRQRLATRTRSWLRPDFQLIPASPHAMRRIIKALASGSNLLLYIDEHKDNLVWGPSLGRTLPNAGNRWLAARLAVSYQADLVPVHVQRICDARYRVVIEPQLHSAAAGREERIADFARQMDQHLEAWVMANPEDWYGLSLFESDKPFS